MKAIISPMLIAVSRYEDFKTKKDVVEFIECFLEEFPQFDTSDSEILKVYSYHRQGIVHEAVYLKTHDKYYCLFFKILDEEASGFHDYEEVDISDIESIGKRMLDDYNKKYLDLK